METWPVTRTPASIDAALRPIPPAPACPVACLRTGMMFLRVCRGVMAVVIVIAKVSFSVKYYAAVIISFRFPSSKALNSSLRENHAANSENPTQQTEDLWRRMVKGHMSPACYRAERD